MSTDFEELFPPVPGGMVDTVRRQHADAQAHTSKLGGLPSLESWSGRYAAIRVREMGAELARARTFAISTANNNPIVEALGQDINRKYAVIMTLDEPVVIAFSVQAADDPRNPVNAAGLEANGFVLPVNVPVPFTYQGGIWLVATSATATRVSVMAFSFTEPEEAK